jgi:hypothetical protein
MRGFEIWSLHLDCLGLETAEQITITEFYFLFVFLVVEIGFV